MFKITRRKIVLGILALTTSPKLRDVFKIKGDGSIVKCRMYDLEPGDLFEVDGYRGVVQDRPFKINGVWGVVSNERSLN
jgi:hypothetical protein